MNRRKPTQHEKDCQLLWGYIRLHDVHVLDAFARIERRATRTSVKGKDYVLHVQEPKDLSVSAHRVYCGRLVGQVNSVTRSELIDAASEQWCQRCIARIKKEQPT